MKNFFKRLKSQKGLSGVMVALLLVVIGVGLVAGINVYLTAKKNDIQNAANNSFTNAGV